MEAASDRKSLKSLQVSSTYYFIPDLLFDGEKNYLNPVPLPIAVPSFLELPCRNNLLFSVKAERQIFIRYERSCRGCRHHLDIMPVNFSPPSWLFPPSANGTCRSPSGSGRFNSNFLRSTAGGCFLLFLLLFSFLGGRKTQFQLAFCSKQTHRHARAQNPYAKKKTKPKMKISAHAVRQHSQTLFGVGFFFVFFFAVLP